MGDSFDVEPEELLAVSTTLRESAGKLDTDAGDIPQAEAGLMTPTIESSVLALLEHCALFAAALKEVSSSTEESALQYHAIDMEEGADLARLMMPGSSEAEIRRTAEVVDRSDEIDLGDLLLPGGRDEAEEAVLNSPSAWDEAEARQDKENEDLRDLLMPEELYGKDGGRSDAD